MTPYTTRRPPSPRRRLAINWELVEQRRIAAGLSHAELRIRVGQAPVTGPPRLWQDSDHDTVELGVLERLCRVLDLQPAELFSAPTRVSQPDPAPPVVTSDDHILEAALATLTAAAVDTTSLDHCGPVSMGALADALEWPLARLEATLATLTDVLAERGQRIDIDTYHQARPVHGLRPRDDLLTSDQREALHRIPLLHQPLHPGTARVLYTATQPGQCVEYQAVIGYNPAVLLQRQGLVQRHPGARYLELTDDVRFALLLDEPTERTHNH
ncbi:MAG: helix-turn-helix transcriptional regulator [Actinomycetota bacterium]|nr:helix-turn-helix transcriptional regulator [Actinomycetota bacterium]